MSHSILSKIHQNDPTLYQHLSNSPNIPPPPIYCTRWVRLLFSREIVGYENVFKLWDVFFEYNIMRVLEVTSACRVLLLRDALLNPENNPLDLLMNMPQLSDITQLTITLRRLMEQTDIDEPIQLPSSQPQPTAPTTQEGLSLHPAKNEQYVVQPMMAHAQEGQMRSPENSNNSFTFSNMRRTLEKKSESLRKKIITTTNEWKEAAKRESSSGSISTSSDIFASGSEVMRDHTAIKPPQPVPFVDPVMRQTFQGLPPSPRQHQHQRWSSLLEQRILTVQEFLMALEAKEGGEKVPGEVWEALADVDRIRRELHNYSMSMGG